MATNPVGKFLPVERSTRFTANRASSKNRGDGFAFVADGEGAAAGADDGFADGHAAGMGYRHTKLGAYAGAARKQGMPHRGD